MKLAVLSGTFNPIHKAHTELAGFVRDNFNYDKILLIPAYKPPFKEEDGDFSLYRLEMVKLAAEELKDIEISEIEYKNEGKSYSYITVKKLYELFKPEEKIGFVIGTDAYVNLDKWYEADKLKQLVDFIVFERGISFDDERVEKIENKGFKLIKASLPFKDISSSEIRKRLGLGESISGLVSQKVEDYIYENGLYK